MQTGTRKLLDRSFTGLGLVSILLLAAALVVVLAPIVIGGSRAFVFRGTVEFRRMMLEKFERGNGAALDAELAGSNAARQPVYQMIANFEKELKAGGPGMRRKYDGRLKDLKTRLRTLLGPFPGEAEPVLARHQYGQTRWDRALVKLGDVLHVDKYDFSDPKRMGKKYTVSRAEEHFKGTSLEPLFPYLETHAEEMLKPRWTFYWRFLFDKEKDAHFFGGIWPEMLGTFYLTIGAILFAVPMGVIAAIYFVEYAPDNHLMGLIRTCVGTLAGVPSIVFGMFGLAFLINSVHVSHGKSVLAGALTLALLVLPIIIRSAEEAIRSVPKTYKEAALSLGASRWWTIVTVILPAALPGILTGIIISMGRAAGETAPIIFTAAASTGLPLAFTDTFTQSTRALSWNIYNIATEHQAVDEIRHVQYGMVLTLVLLVLLLNVAALILRARVARKLKG